MGISIWQLLIILVIILLLFGTKRLKSIGSDLGGAIKGFRESLGDKKGESDAAAAPVVEKVVHQESERVIDVEVTKPPQEDKIAR
ncbi:MAG: sec-independent protein translocase protein TatA [Halothiobacillaceae bacterium]|nr:MAG: sec-independent protein translocase protein TatA [Halothiobacillaceae bacterium]